MSFVWPSVLLFHSTLLHFVLLNMCSSDDVAALHAEIASLRATAAKLEAHMATPSAPPPRITLSEKYGGERSELRGFQDQCDLLFLLYPAAYPMTGKEWAPLFAF
jgi:hypothetical protein